MFIYQRVITPCFPDVFMISPKWFKCLLSLCISCPVISRFIVEIILYPMILYILNISKQYTQQKKNIQNVCSLSSSSICIHPNDIRISLFLFHYPVSPSFYPKFCPVSSWLPWWCSRCVISRWPTCCTCASSCSACPACPAWCPVCPVPRSQRSITSAGNCSRRWPQLRILGNNPFLIGKSS